MKCLLLIVLVVQYSIIYAQSLVGLIDRDNSSSITYAEGQGITIIGLSRGSGINKTTGNALDYNSYGWDESSLSSAISNNDYVQFSISVNQGHLLDLDEIMIRMDRSPQGPVNFELIFSTDNFTTSASVFNLQNISSTNPSTYTINTSTINNLMSGETIYFRMYCWGATSSNGTMDIEGFTPTYTPDGWQPSNQASSDPGIAFLGCTSAIPVSNSSIWPVNNSSVKIDWNNPKCYSQILIIGKDGSTPTFNPTSHNCHGTNGDCTSSDFNSNASFSTGASNLNLPQDEYCVYKGVGNSAIISNLTNGNNYYFKIYTYLNPWSDLSTSPFLSVSALPVSLSKFEGNFEHDIIQLKWETSSELNNDYFKIQKSDDGIEFINMSIIKGKGTSSMINHYSFDDYNPFPVSYYRLKQVDFDGSINYSKVICIRKNESSYNLRKGQEYIEITSNNSIATDYEIINTYGTKIKTGDFLKSFQIVKAEYSNGIYFIRLKSPYKMELLKWINN